MLSHTFLLLQFFTTALSISNCSFVPLFLWQLFCFSVKRSFFSRWLISSAAIPVNNSQISGKHAIGLKLLTLFPLLLSFIEGQSGQLSASLVLHLWLCNFAYEMLFFLALTQASWSSSHGHHQILGPDSSPFHHPNSFFDFC